MRKNLEKRRKNYEIKFKKNSENVSNFSKKKEKKKKGKKKENGENNSGIHREMFEKKSQPSKKIHTFLKKKAPIITKNPSSFTKNREISRKSETQTVRDGITKEVATGINKVSFFGKHDF